MIYIALVFSITMLGGTPPVQTHSQPECKQIKAIDNSHSETLTNIHDLKILVERQKKEIDSLTAYKN